MNRIVIGLWIGTLFAMACYDPYAGIKPAPYQIQETRTVFCSDAGKPLDSKRRCETETSIIQDWTD